MKKWFIKSTTLAAVLALVLTACGGGGSDPAPIDTNLTPKLSGRAIAGPVALGAVTAYELNADGSNGRSLGTAQTDNNGAFTLSLSSVPTGGVRLVVSGGSYVSEANTAITVNGVSLSAILTSVSESGVSDIAITPLTAFSDQRLLNLLSSAGSLSEAQTQADAFVSSIYGIQGSDALFSLMPDFTATSGDTARLALVLGALEQLAINSGRTPSEIINAIGSDIADGLLDGKTVGGGVIYYDSTTAAPATLANSQFMNAVTQYLSPANTSIVTAHHGVSLDPQTAPALRSAVFAHSSVGTIRGVVVSNANGLPVGGAMVTVETSSTTTGADGSYVIPDVPATPRAVVNISANNYLSGSKVTAVFTNKTSRADVALLPVARTMTLTPANLSVPQTLAVPNSSATFVLPANALQTATGAAISGNVLVLVTPLDPSSNPQIIPGDYVTNDGGLIESLGALDVSIRDATGMVLNPAPGSSYTIRIPVAAARQASPPATMELWYYSAATGQWVHDGTLTLGGTAPNRYYEGVIARFSLWSASERYTTTCITGKVLDTNGNPVSNARVDSEGQGYAGTSTAYSAADGSFTLQIKANASVIITAKTADAQSNSEVVTGGAAGTSCTPILTDLRLGSTVGGSARIKLTWGASPGDLDSHLTGPVEGSTTRFHIYFVYEGSQMAAPYAELDVDDVSSFGPEVITINRFTPGLYRYSVHHYSGTSTIPASPARVELTLNGVTRVFTPPPSSTALASGSVWVVMELNVDSSGAITVTPVNTYETASAGGSERSVTAVSGKPPLVGGNW